MIHFPRMRPSPLRALGLRLAAAVGLVVAIVLVVYVDRDGYRDVTEDAAEPARLRLLRGRHALDHRVRRHHPGHADGPADQRPGHHPGARALPDHPGRHDPRGADRAVPRQPPSDPLEAESEGPRDRLRLRHEGPQRGPRAAGERPGQGPDRGGRAERGPPCGRRSPTGWSASRAPRPARRRCCEAHVKTAKAVIIATHSDDAAVLVTLTVRQLTGGPGADHRRGPRGGERAAAQAERRAPRDRVGLDRGPAARPVDLGAAADRRGGGPVDARRRAWRWRCAPRSARRWVAVAARRWTPLVIALVRRGKVVSLAEPAGLHGGDRRHARLRRRRRPAAQPERETLSVQTYRIVQVSPEVSRPASCSSGVPPLALALAVSS